MWSWRVPAGTQGPAGPLPVATCGAGHDLHVVTGSASLSFCTRFWMLRKPPAREVQQGLSSRITSWRSLFLRAQTWLSTQHTRLLPVEGGEGRGRSSFHQWGR